MNKAILVGRLVRDPEVRYGGANNIAVARYTLAVERKFKRDGEPTADFIQCTVFGRAAEFAEKYFRQGLRISVSGRIQTNNYTNKDGQKVYSTTVIVEEQEFAESRSEQKQSNIQAGPSPYGSAPDSDGFMNIPSNISDELPFE